MSKSSPQKTKPIKAQTFNLVASAILQKSKDEDEALAKGEAAEGDKKDSFFEVEGLSRVNASSKKLDETIREIIKNPSRTKDIMGELSPPEAIGTLTKATKRLLENPAIQTELSLYNAQIAKFAATNNSENQNERNNLLSTMVQNLINNGSIEEAKAIHNLFYVYRKIAEAPNNKMDSKNAAMSLAGIFGTLPLELGPAVILKLNGAMSDQMSSEMMSDNFAGSFDEIYPEAANKLATGSPSQPKRGITMPAWVGALGTTVANTWSARPAWLGGKSEAAVSAPYNVNQGAKTPPADHLSAKAAEGINVIPTGIVKERTAQFSQNPQVSAPAPIIESEPTQSRWSKLVSRENLSSVVSGARALLGTVVDLIATGAVVAGKYIGRTTARLWSAVSEQWANRSPRFGGKQGEVKLPDNTVVGSNLSEKPVVEQTQAVEQPQSVEKTQDQPEKYSEELFANTMNAFMKGEKPGEKKPSVDSLPSQQSDNSNQSNELRDKWVKVNVDRLQKSSFTTALAELSRISYDELFSKHLMKDTEMRHVFDSIRAPSMSDERYYIDLSKLKSDDKDGSEERKKLTAGISNEKKRAVIDKFIVELIKADKIALTGTPQHQKKAVEVIYNGLQEVKKGLGTGLDTRPEFVSNSGNGKHAIPVQPTPSPKVTPAPESASKPAPPPVPSRKTRPGSGNTK